jgi:hypothetical protein
MIEKTSTDKVINLCLQAWISAKIFMEYFAFQNVEEVALKKRLSFSSNDDI